MARARYRAEDGTWRYTDQPTGPSAPPPPVPGTLTELEPVAPLAGGGTEGKVQVYLPGPLPVEWGGTGASDLPTLLKALGAGVGNIVAIETVAPLAGGGTEGTVRLSLTVPITVAQGGTGADDAAGARANIGAAPIRSARLTGRPTAPTPRTDGGIATKGYVDDETQKVPGKILRLEAGPGIALPGNVDEGAVVVAIDVPVAVARGGTGAVTPEDARSKLGALGPVSPVLRGTPTAPLPDEDAPEGQVATVGYVDAVRDILRREDVEGAILALEADPPLRVTRDGFLVSVAIDSPLGVGHGGTGADSVAGARAALEVLPESDAVLAGTPALEASPSASATGRELVDAAWVRLYAGETPIAPSPATTPTVSLRLPDPAVEPGTPQLRLATPSPETVTQLDLPDFAFVAPQLREPVTTDCPTAVTLAAPELELATPQLSGDDNKASVNVALQIPELAFATPMPEFVPLVVTKGPPLTEIVLALPALELRTPGGGFPVSAGALEYDLPMVALTITPPVPVLRS